MSKILIVDDDPTVCELIGELLTREGHSVTVAKDGIDAMVILKKEKPDLLILDIMMPDMNGYDVCYHLKNHPETRDLAIIILTSRDQEIDPRLGNLMGVGYLHKSALPATLLALVRKTLGTKEPHNKK